MSERRLHLGDGWRKLRRIVEDVINAASEDNVPMMAAAISYYLLLTIAPLLVALSLAAASLTRALDPEASAEASSILGVSAGATTVSVIVTARNRLVRCLRGVQPVRPGREPHLERAAAPRSDVCLRPSSPSRVSACLAYSGLDWSPR